VFLKRNACAHTYNTKCLYHLLTAFALFSFFFSRFFYVCIFACTTYTNAIISLCLCSFRAFLLSISLSRAHITHVLDVCMCIRILISFFVVSFLLLIAHNDGDTRIEGRNLTKKKEECACIHVIVRSNRQKAFYMLYVFSSAFSLFFFIQGHSTDKSRSIKRIVYIQIYSI
jgi:hypothetical protein